MIKNNIARKAVWALALTPLLAIMFTGLLTVSFALPNDPIVKNLLDREDLLNERRANNGRVIDADTECIGLSVGLYQSDPDGDSAFQRAVHSESLYGCDQFIKWLKTGETNAHRDYFRYWHGYTIVTRPLLSVLPYNDLRGFLFYASILLVGILAWRLGHDFNASVALAFVLPFLILNAMGYWVVATKAVTWFLMIGGALALSHRKSIDGSPPVLLFFILGAFTAFWDFFTAPVLVFTIPALVYFLYAYRNGDRKNPLQRLLLFSVFWGAGYVGLWVVKFALAAAVLDLPVWKDVFDAMAFRLRGASDHVDSFLPGAAIYQNIAALKSFWGPTALVLFVVLPLATHRRRSRWVELFRDGRVFIALALTPILWLEVMSNHSQIHAAFTHLNFAPAAILAGLVLMNQTSLFTKGADSSA